ncbi:MAG: glutamine amidotransferase-related protein [Anaerolineae bacterium]
MICYIDIEHESVLEDPQRRDAHLAWVMDVKLRLEELSSVPCLVQHYFRVRRERLRAWGIRAVIISGNASDWETYPTGAFDALYEIIREADIPILDICGGFQLIATAHGAPAGPIRPLTAGEEGVNNMGAGYFKEWGFLPVEVVKPAPFRGAGGASHRKYARIGNPG